MLRLIDNVFFRFLISITALIFGVLPASEFHSEYNHFSGNEIIKIKVCGERCSGTNFVRCLLLDNFPGVLHARHLEYGHKHFLWWFGTPADTDKLKKLRYTMDAVDLPNSQNCLFIIVVRDPYDWLRSFYLVPHSVHKDLCGKGFFHFISSEWKGQDEHHPMEGEYDQIDNCHPWQSRPFRNILELRQQKTANYINLSNRVANFLFVRYEDVDYNQSGFVDFVSKYYGMEKKVDFTPMNIYKGWEGQYVKKKYFPIDMNELNFINEQIDWEMEHMIGYSQKSKVD